MSTVISYSSFSEQFLYDTVVKKGEKILLFHSKNTEISIDQPCYLINMMYINKIRGNQ